MKKFTPLAAIASGLGGYIVLALLSSSPSWFEDSKSEKEELDQTSPAVMEVSRTDEANAEPLPANGERS